MEKGNAKILHQLEGIGGKLFPFKSSLKREILLIIAAHGGVCDMRLIFKVSKATSIALRYSIKSLEEDGYVELFVDEADRRSKQIHFKERGVVLMREYEQQCGKLLSAWQQPIEGNISSFFIKSGD